MCKIFSFNKRSVQIDDEKSYVPTHGLNCLSIYYGV